MMIADIIIEFTYLIMRILYNIVKYIGICVIWLVKYIIRKLKKRKIKKNLEKGNFNISKDKNGKYLLTIGGSNDE